MGSRTFWKVQYGKETFATKGTPVAATKKFLGSFNVPEDISPVYPDYNLSLRAKAAESHIYQYLADGISLNVDNGYFQILPMMLSTTLLGNLTPAEKNSGKTDWEWLHVPSMSAGADTLDACTIQFGDDDQEYVSEYCIGKSFSLKGATGGNSAVSLGWEGMGRQVAKGTFTGGLSNPVIEPIVANVAKLYMDATWANVGNTEVTNILRDFDFQLLNGVHPKFLGSTKTFTKHGESYLEAMLTLTVEGGANAIALYDLYRNRGRKAFQLKIEGSQIMAGSANYSILINMFADVEKAVPLSGDADGNSLYQVALHGVYDPTGSGAEIAIKVVTNNNTI
jgi:hypothetical protein